MLKLSSVSSGGIKVGVKVGKDYPSHPHFAEYGFGHGQNYDIVHDILNSCYIPIDGIQSEYFVGIQPDYVPPVVYTNSGNKPFEQPYFNQSDWHKYSNPFGILVTGLTESRPIHGENQVRKLSLDGTLSRSRFRGVNYENGFTAPIWGVQLPVCDQSYSGDRLYFPKYEILPPYSGSDFSLYSYIYGITSPLETVMKILTTIEDNSSMIPFVGYTSLAPYATVKCYGMYGSYPYTSCVFDITTDGHRSIRWTNFTSNGGYALRTRISATFSVYSRGNTHSPSTGLGVDVFGIHTIYEVDYQVFSLSLLPASIYGTWEPIPGKGGTFVSEQSASEDNFPLEAKSIHFDSPPELLREDKSSTANAIEYTFSENLGDFRPSVMMSFVDAAKKLNAFRSNYIEVIGESEELLHLAPSIKDALAAFMHARDGNLIDAALSVGDFLSSTYLLASFGWRPAVSNSRELLEKAKRVGDSFKILSAARTVNGKFSYDFSQSYKGYSGLHLKTRSKVRFRGVDEGFVLQAMKLDSIGLLPSSSNLWDLLPFSWLADYFVNLGTRLTVVDSIILAILNGIEFATHSYEISGNIPVSFLNQNELIGDTLAPPTFSVYFREVSRVVPLLFDSKIDYGANPYGPDNLILASLLWQIVRAYVSSTGSSSHSRPKRFWRPNHRPKGS